MVDPKFCTEVEWGVWGTPKTSMLQSNLLDLNNTLVPKNQLVTKFNCIVIQDHIS